MLKVGLLVILILVILKVNADQVKIKQDQNNVFMIEQLGETLNWFISQFWEDKKDVKKLESIRYDQDRENLIKASNAEYFTVDVPKLTDDELRVDKYLSDLKEEISQGDHSPLLLPFYDSKKIIEQSEIHKALYRMPKGAHLHLHVSAAIPLDFMIKLTYEDNVYYSMVDNRLNTFLDEPLAGYQKCNDIRRNWKQQGTFDEFLRSKIILTAEEIKSQESSEIWKIFQNNFSLTSGLFKYSVYYREGLLEICKLALQEGIFIVELRKSAGGLLDVDLDGEMHLYQSVLDEMKTMDPDFELTLIITSGKTNDQSAIEQLSNYNYARKRYSFVAGFDLVNEEDTSLPIYHFKDLIQEARRDADVSR